MIFLSSFLEISANMGSLGLILFHRISGHVMYSAIAPTLSALIFARAERATQETAINAQI